MTKTVQYSITVMLAASFASTIGGLPFNALPILLGSLADDFGISAQQTGLLGSICFSGYFAGTLSSVLILNLLCWRKMTGLIAIVAASTLLLSAIAPVEWQQPLWALLGFCAALMTCLGLRIMGDMHNKERALGLRQGIELGVTALVLFIIPAYVTTVYGYKGAAILLAVIILILSLSAFGLPSKNNTTESKIPLSQQLKIPATAWAALFTFFVFGAGNIGLWAFLERMGTTLELLPTELGTVFAVLKLLGGGSALLLAVVGDRLGLRLPYIVVLAVITVGLAILWYANDFISFALGAWIWEVGFTWGCVYQTATIARLDPQGRAIMLIPAAFGLSSMAGPGIAGMLVGMGAQQANYAPLLSFAFATSVFAVVICTTVLAVNIARAKQNLDIVTSRS
ncbi:MFS transporter [Vibrio sinensis]|uniref:MFS transporter n=1 Tax=Vibrio sinensis TaxID=2302434 RepID=A0A3A6R345_9VIBR|nr:MFS transporter [Vibrio sinensis]RJX75557.1 MFS transporter [Vibrio sinensis]